MVLAMKAFRTTIQLSPPPPFDFGATAYSHGWVVLPPNTWDEKARTIQRVERLGAGKVVLLRISGDGTARKPSVDVSAESPARLTKRERDEITANVSHMLRLDEDFREFYRLAAKRGGHWTGVTSGKGRLLRSSSIFEDVIKVICTTNIQWGGTKKMAGNLVTHYGERYAPQPELRAFPAPEAIAAADRDDFAANVRMGYRAPYVHELAAQVANGKTSLESLRDPEMPTGELKRRLRAIKGVGPYAAATLLMLLGHYDDLAVDTVARGFVSKKYFGGKKISDAEIRAIYDGWGKWKFLAYWYDLWSGFNEKL